MAQVNLPFVGNVVQVGDDGDATTFYCPADANLAGHASWKDSLADGDTAYYLATSVANKNEWEFGLGTWAESAQTLTRTTVLRGSNGTTKVEFSPGAVELKIAFTGISHLADYTVTGTANTRSISASESTAANIAVVLATLISDLIAAGVLK